MIKKKILIATGGTGGHVFPAYSLASYLKNKNYNVQISIDKRGLRYLKDYKNFKVVEIPSSPLIKKKLIQIFLFIINYFLFNNKIIFIFVI